MSSIFHLLLTKVVSDPQYELMFQILKLWSYLQEIIILLLTLNISVHWSSKYATILLFKDQLY